MPGGRQLSGLHSLLLSVCQSSPTEIFAGRLFQGAPRRRVSFLSRLQGVFPRFSQVGVIFGGLHRQDPVAIDHNNHLYTDSFAAKNDHLANQAKRRTPFVLVSFAILRGRHRPPGTARLPCRPACAESSCELILLRGCTACHKCNNGQLSSVANISTTKSLGLRVKISPRRGRWGTKAVSTTMGSSGDDGAAIGTAPFLWEGGSTLPCREPLAQPPAGWVDTLPHAPDQRS